MRLAFYYHIPICIKDRGVIHIPSFLGVFVDALAQEVNHFILVMHQANGGEVQNCDYALTSKNISWINLGRKTPAWHRALLHKKLLKDKLQALDADCFLVRSPSPLAPYFHYYFPQNKISFLIVGDYESALDSKGNKSIRQLAMDYYLKYNSYLFKKAIQKTPILVNSPTLFNKYKDLAPSCNLVGTTTLSKMDFFERNDTCTRDVIKLLYTGRIDLQKGLLELVTIAGELINEGLPIELHIVGWEDVQEKPVEHHLNSKAKQHGILDKVFFHGRKRVGEELNQLYRMADIYVIPSYHEGFPRTIWEAMANSLPVIATEVGAIPKLLTHQEHALIIPPKNEKALKSELLKLINDSNLRQYLIKNARNLATNYTLDVLAKQMILKLKKNE